MGFASPQHHRSAAPIALLALVTYLFFAGEAGAQAAPDVTRLSAEPDRIVVTVGTSTPFRVQAYDSQGREVEAPVRYAFPRVAVWVADGEVHGATAGEYEIVATAVVPPDYQGDPPSVRLHVTVRWPTISAVEITQADEGALYAGTTIRHSATARHGDGLIRPEPDIRWSTSDAAVATVDRFGYVTAHRSGSVSINAEAEGVPGTVRHTVRGLAKDARSGLRGPANARTGDVVVISSEIVGGGRRLADVPITWSYTVLPMRDDPHPRVAGRGTAAESRGAAAQVVNGRFVADLPGRYTVLAQAANLQARHNIEVVDRNVVQQLTVVGHARTTHVRSSDHHIFEGRDGRYYAIVGTWVANGGAYIWDVTDPANMFLTDSIMVDARTINDVKVSPDARYAVITREGASNRVNGAIILDLANPAHPVIATNYTDGLTGGVHNSWPTEDYLYVLSGGEKYLILDMKDIYNPRYVGEYNHPNSRIHDVIVHNGIAYSSEWNSGVVVVDVGNGGWGGSPENPVFITNYVTPGGATHTVWPYHQESTGRLLLFVTDEIMNRPGKSLPGGFDRFQYDPETGEGGRPPATSGYVHILDATNLENIHKIARFRVPEHGTHNPWVENDILYQAYFEGGVRVVDVSGELMGDLYSQGREIAAFKTNDPEGWIPNAPFVWSVTPYKGYIFASDGHSGLWALKLEPRKD